MQTLDIHRPEMPDLQFALVVTALSTSRLIALNIPGTLRTTIFDRCWVLIHDSPPPGRPEERVLDLRPWSEMTLDAMAKPSAWPPHRGGHPHDWPGIIHPASRQDQHAGGAAFIDRLAHLYPQQSKLETRPVKKLVNRTQEPVRMRRTSEVQQFISEMAALMAAFSPALKHRAADLAAGGKAASWSKSC